MPEIVPTNVACEGTMQPGGKVHDIAESIVQIAARAPKRSTTTETEEPMALMFFGHAVYLSSAALGVATLANTRNTHHENAHRSKIVSVPCTTLAFNLLFSTEVCSFHGKVVLVLNSPKIRLAGHHEAYV
jgi:hypothetical protein